ncbi:ClC family H(+)/Cl(-) exchange transporter [Anaerococcus porci]|uniref:ClC family H(+)/Cl(-) exchange transporter n=1 Tax=Anaerococcus porci TaxID=2652269 RepID=UPI002A74DAEC|nr:ClC family H(+)/Cl(-) exchange transporter [Anaerococcus porci]MDY3006085.1 ClC family H(+)/Cl(-) exchange transporter [Anaerococcus porci]
MEEKISYKLIFISIIIGFISGLVVSLFRIVIPKLIYLIAILIEFGQKGLLESLIFIAMFLLIGYIVAICVDKEPMIGGSGIPQISGKLNKKLSYNPLTCLIYKLIGGTLSIGSGLSLGREGPSVQIAGSIGEIISDIFKLSQNDKDIMIVASSSSGITSAFTAPISAIAFSIEELMKKSKRIGFIYITLTVISASLVTSFLIGNSPVIKINNSLDLSSKYWPYLLFLAILVGLSSLIFNKGILYGKYLYNKLTISQKIKYIIPFFITSIVLLLDKRMLGSGENFIGLAQNGNEDIKVLIYFYVVKLLLLFVAFCSGIPGGIFFPLLALGALVGNIYGSILFKMGFVGENEIIIFSMLSMAAHFGSIVRAPLTGIFLILEMTGGKIDFLLPIVIVTLMAYIVSELTKNEPIYESLLDIIIKRKMLS